MGSSYSPFCVPFNASTLRTPRKMRVVCIGAGLAGLTFAYKIQHEAKLADFVDLTIYERQVSDLVLCVQRYTFSWLKLT
jgi:ribulose 1,5-bisphosphate synthetase/thiazole synthase